MKTTIVVFLTAFMATVQGRISGWSEGYGLNFFTNSNLSEVREKNIKLASGVQLSYVEEGDAAGANIIFLHGYTDSWHSFESVLKLFPKEYHLFAVSLRGHGNSSKPDDGYDAKHFAEDVAMFIEEKKLGPCILVGHSMSGLVVQQFAIDYSHLARAIVLVSSDASFGNNPGTAEFLRSILTINDPVSRDFVDSFQKSTLVNPIDSCDFNLYVSESMKVPANAWRKMAYMQLTTDYRKRARRIKCPALIIGGSSDLICPQDDQRKLAKIIPNATLLIYADTGHALHWEKPRRFIRDLVNFAKHI